MSDAHDDSEPFDALLAKIARAPSLEVRPGERRLGSFTLLRKLGEGAFGSVFEARDERDGSLAALKVLRAGRADWLLRFKREFRLLANVVHENLVRLHELSVEGDEWFFTMELVHGETFVGAISQRPESLTDAFVQLLRGLSAIHQAGRLHRDIKPSNVLVEPGGRVVVLDFGLAITRDAAESTQVAGTPLYMAPEQALLGPLSEACDLYGVGVMLYQALTGREPFSGSALEILSHKQTATPPDPRELAPHTPSELAELCRRLLAPIPSERPSANAALEVLLALVPENAPGSSQVRSGETFIGRRSELASLSLARSTVAEGQPAVALLAGSSGMGKTALLSHFLERTRELFPSALVLRGQCYAQEAIPYKALDAVIDQLARTLSRLPSAEVRALLPRHADALGQLFPVLREVEGIRELRVRATSHDRQEDRRRAMVALRELFARIADRRSVIIAVDDLQWGDADSAVLLGELLRPPDAPALLFLGAYRTEEATTSPLLRAFAELRRGVLTSVATQTVEVGALESEDAAELIKQLLAGLGTDESLSDRIRTESRGCPFLVHELARADHSTAPRVDAMVLERVARLPGDAKGVLDIVALAARPVPISLLRAVAPNIDLRRALAALRAQRLLRSRGLAGEEALEIYHDRIREAVTADLAPEAKTRLHRTLAEALDNDHAEGAEHLASHLIGAGDLARASALLRAAATRAAEALAFDHAAVLLRQVLELDSRRGCDDVSARRQLLRELGDTLACAGKGGDAADAYLAAAQGLPPDKAFELRRLAGAQLFLAGHMERGREVLGALFEREGLRLPPAGFRAGIVSVGRIAHLKVRGYGFRERSESEVAPKELRRIELLSAAGLGLFSADPIAASALVSELTLRALDAGVPARILDALAIHVGVLGLLSQGHSDALRALNELTLRLGTPYAVATNAVTEMLVASFQGRWREALLLLDEAEPIIREHGVRVTAWSRAQFFRFDAYYWMGRVGAAAEGLPATLQDLRERGNRMGLVWMSLIWSWVVCAHGRPAEAREVLDHALRQWGKGGMLPIWWRVHNELNVALYEGSGERAQQLLRESPFRFHHLRFAGREARAQHHWGHARACLASARESPRERARFLLEAEKHLQQLRGENVRWSNAFEPALRACVHHLRGDAEQALRLLGAAEPRVREVDMEMIVAAIQRMRGQLLGGDSGRELVAQAKRWATANGVADLDRFASIYLPGATAR